MFTKRLSQVLFFVSCLIIAACSNDDDGVVTPPSSNPGCTNCEETIDADYDPQPYEFDLPAWLTSEPIIPEDNPMTIAGVELGRHLFYDPILSADSTMSCSSCHVQSLGFTDGLAVSEGINGEAGTRSSMAIVNLAFNNKGFFWDGRVQTLEEQAVLPIIDDIELDDTWENVELKLRRHEKYPAMFREAFGIETKGEITQDLATKAIAQFERSIVSFDSKFDRVSQLNEGWLSDEEELGRQLFTVEPSQQVNDHPGCSHCHFNPLFTDNDYRNNGLDDVENLEDFEDTGLGGVNNNVIDYGKFRVPTLRNIALTGPYMHDGRFETLEEVIESYKQGGHGVINEDPNILPFTLSEEDKSNLLEFLHTLTDESFLTNPAYSNPFE